MPNPLSHLQLVPRAPKQPIAQNEVQAGDILMFRPSREVWFVQEIIKTSQALVGARHGHYDTTHVAICVGHDDQGKPVIAHVHEKHGSMGFIKEKLQELFTRDDGDRPFLAFRHRDPATRHRIADTAGADHNHQHGFKWELKVGIKTLVGFGHVNPADEIGLGIVLSASTVCSKFAIQVMKKAHDSHHDNIQHYPKIHSTSSPKALEAFLYDDSLYDEYCYLGENALNTIKQCINEQILRFKERGDPRSMHKYQMAQSQLEIAESIILKSRMNELEQCTYLTKVMLPVFAQSTGWGFFATTSHTALLSKARKMGIFTRDIEQFSIDDIMLPAFAHG